MPNITIDELEALIDKLGRDRVLQRAYQLGWTESPPVWVWNCIVAEIAEEDRARSRSQNH